LLFFHYATTLLLISPFHYFAHLLIFRHFDIFMMPFRLRRRRRHADLRRIDLRHFMMPPYLRRHCAIIALIFRISLSDYFH